MIFSTIPPPTNFWMNWDGKDYVAACFICVCSNSQRSLGLLQPQASPQRPWSHTAFNFITGLPSFSGTTVILSIIDRFWKSAHFVALEKLIMFSVFSGSMAYLWRLFQTGTLNSPPKSGNISALGQPEFWILPADQRPNWEAQSGARIGHQLHYNSKHSHLVLTVPTGRVHIQFTYLGMDSGGPTPHRRLAAPLYGSPLNTHSQIWTWTEGVASSEGHSSKTLLVSALTVYSDRMRSRPFGS